MVDQRIACLTTDASLILLFGDASPSTYRAGTDTGRLHTVLYPLIAAVALDHLTIRMTIARCPKGAGHSATLAANTVGIIVYRKSGLRILAQTAYGTGRDAGCIHAVHTCCGNISIISASICQLDFVVKCLPVAQIATNNIRVILVQTAHHTGGTGTAFTLVKYKNMLHGYWCS